VVGWEFASWSRRVDWVVPRMKDSFLIREKEKRDASEGGHDSDSGEREGCPQSKWCVPKVINLDGVGKGVWKGRKTKKESCYLPKSAKELVVGKIKGPQRSRVSQAALDKKTSDDKTQERKAPRKESSVFNRKKENTT